MEQRFRHEYKYLICWESARLLERRLRAFLKPDAHAGPTGRYTIRSLYFDDFGNSAFYEKVDGVDHRTKYRIRMYDGDLSFLRLEKKEKEGHLTRKTGQTIDADLARTLVEGGAIPGGDGLARELVLLCRTQGLRPRVLVDYDRTPFVCAPGNVRITLDENLRTRPYQARLDAPGGGMIPVLEPGQVILEVKYDDFLPGYLAQVLGDIPKAPMAISKYALCMNLL